MRRWAEQSRTPRDNARPSPSPNICTSRCLAWGKNFSKKIPAYNIAVSVIEYQNKILISRRENSKLLSGLWEFPGGKIERNENAYEAVIREIKEETNLTISNPIYLGNVKHKYSHFGVDISLFISKPRSIKKLLIKQQYKWINIQEIENYPLPKANHKMLDILKKLD